MDNFYPNTPEFKELEKYTTMRTDAYNKGEYASTWNTYFKEGELPKEFLPWMRQNWEYLKYRYIKNLLTLDGIYATITLENYCKEAYVIFKHNLYLEKFENLEDEIKSLTGES